jgi:hypothetical protein
MTSDSSYSGVQVPLLTQFCAHPTPNSLVESKYRISPLDACLCNLHPTPILTTNFLSFSFSGQPCRNDFPKTTFLIRYMSYYYYGPTALCWSLAAFFSFLILYTVGTTPWTGDQPVTRPLPTHRTTQTQNKRTQTSMP